MEKSNSKKIKSLQILRFLCLISVILAHSGYFQYLSLLSVSVFFVLSGFVLMYSYHSREMKEDVKSLIGFSWSKIKKLYYLNILVTTSILFIELYALYKGNNEYDLATILLYYLLQIFLVQTFTPGVEKIDFLNSPSWYSSVSMMLYFFFPIIKKQVKRISATGNCIIYIIALYALKFILTYLFRGVEDPVYLLYFSPYFRFFDFIIGCLLALVYEDLARQESDHRLINFTALILLLILVIVNSSQNVVYWAYYSLQYLPASIFIVLAVALLDKRMDENSSLTKTLIYLGDLSGYAYIIHAMVVEYLKQLYVHFFRTEINGLLLFAAAIVLTYFLSYLYQKVVNVFKCRKSIKIVDSKM